MARLSKMLRFRASPARITKANKKMTKAQRERIKNEEFGALLKFACGRIPAELASWLMSDCFDPESSQLVLPGRGRIAVTADSVARVLGLPNSGDKVIYDFDVAAINFINEKYGIEKGLAPTIETILERLMKNREADDDFFRSWLMIVVSTFLCPTTSLSISSKCYPSLVDLSVVKNLNWCQFVVDQLKYSAQQTFKKNSILYLDSLDVGTLEIPATEPRIAVWTWKLLDKVIKLDTNHDKTFGKLKLKRLDHQGSSVIHNSLFQIDDIRRFVSSKFPKPMSNQNKRKISDAVAQFSTSVTDAMGKFLEQANDAASPVPPSTQKHTRVKRARTCTTRANQNEDTYSSEDSDYVVDSENEYDDSDGWGSDGWKTDGKEDLESVLGDDMDGMGHGGKNDASDGATNTSARIPQDRDTEKVKSGPNHSTSTTESEEIDEQDNVTLITRLEMMKKSASADKRRIDDKVSHPIPLEVVPDATCKDVTDDKASHPTINKGNKEDRRAKLKLPLRTGPADDGHAHGCIGSQKNKSDGDLTALKKKGTGQHIQWSRSLDFTPPRCDIMRFIDDDNDTNSQPAALACSNQGNKGAHIESEPDSINSVDDIDLDMVDKLEHEYIRRKLYAEAENNKMGTSTDIGHQQPTTSKATPPFVPQQDASVCIPEQQDVSSNRSVTPAYQPPPMRPNKKAAILRSPFIDFTGKKAFKCSKEASQLYDALCASTRRSTRSSSQSPSKDIIIVNYHQVYATLQEVAESVKPGGKLLNAVAEVGLFAVQPMALHSRKRVFPLRIATYLLSGQTERKEVNFIFASARNHLDRWQLVMFPVLQEIENRGLEKVRHYFLLVLNLRNGRFEVIP